MLRLLRHVSTLQLALGLSIAVHAALLTVRFVAPAAFDRIFQDTPLEVILVNAKSQAAPDKGQAIAQASLAGGGNVEKGRASSPLPYSALTATGDETEDAQRQMDRLLQEQQQLLVQVRRRLAKMPAPDPRQVHQSAEAGRRKKSASSSSACWPRSKSASTRKTRARASATSAPPRARPSTRCTTTSCGARWRTGARATFPRPGARSSMASW